MQKVLRTAAVVVAALSVVGLTGTSAFATTGADPLATGMANGNTIIEPAAGTTDATTGTGTNDGGDADNVACNTTVVIIDNGDDPAQEGDTSGTTTGDCPVTPAPTQPETPGMGGGTPMTPAVPVTPAPSTPVAMTLPDTGASSLGNLASSVLTLVATASGLFIAGYRTLRANV